MSLINTFLKDMITNPDKSYSTKRVMGWFVLVSLILFCGIAILKTNVNETIFITICSSLSSIFTALIITVSYDNGKLRDNDKKSSTT